MQVYIAMKCPFEKELMVHRKGVYFQNSHICPFEIIQFPGCFGCLPCLLSELVAVKKASGKYPAILVHASPNDKTILDLNKDESDPTGIAGLRSNIIEIGGRFKSGISNFSKNIPVSEITKMTSNLLQLGEEEEEDSGRGAVGVTDKVVAFDANAASIGENASAKSNKGTEPAAYHNETEQEVTATRQRSRSSRLLALLPCALIRNCADVWFWFYSKEEAGMKTAKLRVEKEVLDRQQLADIDAQKNLIENLQQLENWKHEFVSQEKQMQERLKKILDAVKKHDEEQKRVKEEQREMKNKLQRSRDKHDNLRKRLDEVEDQLRELKAERHKNERDARLSQAVETLKHLFPGVHGRMTDLCRPAQK
ncbi:hypothetical protein T459_04118 [Capsicum annuum]|uniref:Uncharacterized protein n=2 Tax=Capsicum annuum TaxID=4072 RepID=A0A2G3A438_CAPAN|nr:hypothetical protein T459_04118 [Capsicum annuum]